MYFSPKTSADGLVFHYDTGNTVRSYLGEPTTNLAYAANSYLNSNSNWWINAGNATFNDNDTSIQKPVIPNVDTSNLRIFSAVVTGTGGNQQLGSTIVTVSPSTTYSFSIYYYFTGTTMQIPPYVRTLVNNDLLAYFAYNGDTNYLNWPRNKWILLKATVTTQANENGIYMSSYTGDTLGEKLAYFGYQVEQKSHCTPLVLGTRSATQGLKDLTGGSTIDISPASFNSNAEIEYDGSNDYITTPSKTWPFANGGTVEQVVKPITLNREQGFFTLNPYGGTYINFWMPTNNTMRWEVIGTTSTGYSTINTTTAFQVGKYFHVVGTFDGTTTKIYLNGVLENSQTMTNQPTSVTCPLEVGRYSSSYPSSAQIPITKVYNRPLTADEVARNFNAIKSRFNIG